MIVEGAKDPNSTGYVHGFHGDGYLASAILYAVCFVCDFLTPSAIAFIGLKLSIVTGAVTFSMFLTTFYWLMEELLYSASVLWGAGNALISVALVGKI